ncbi:MAG: hypothetical protein KDK06_02185, partial [Gammaproteobacteria bacterium]|nr:hypothetical protein [Gammaproteobacteria bacterium]
VATSAVFAVLWLVTLFAWWRARGRPPAAGAADAGQADVATVRAASAASALKSACAADDAAAACNALQSWGATRGPGDCRSLRDVVARVETAALADAVLALERALYGRHPEAWRGAALWEAFRLEPRRRSRPAHDHPSAATLPALAKLGGK